jgi:hypothetical protein
MESSKAWVLFTRFIRGFLATAIPVITVELAKGYDLSNPVDLKRLIASLATPLVAGLLLALEKWSRWVDPEQPEPLTNEPEAVETKSVSQARKRKRTTA